MVDNMPPSMLLARHGRERDLLSLESWTELSVNINTVSRLLKCWSSAFLFIRPHPTKGITQKIEHIGFAPIFPDICYHLTHYKPAAADIPVASDNPAHYADAIRYNARTPLQGSLLPLTRLVWTWYWCSHALSFSRSSLLFRYSPDSAPPCSSVQVPTSGRTGVFH